MNLKTTIVALILAACQTTWAANPVKVQHQGNSKYLITSGNLSMVIDGGAGGKILSFKHKKKEVLSQSKDDDTYGSTFWTSPQKEWNWPPIEELDKESYVCEQRPTSLYMTSQASAKHKWAVCKEFAVDSTDNSFVITYSIINVSFEPRSVAPWEVTRVPNQNGLIFFDAEANSITPSDLIPFKQEFNALWYQTDVNKEDRKVMIDGKGWIAYACNGLLLIKQFDDITKQQTAPGEAEIELYVNNGKTYIDLECQGIYKSIMPGQQLNWTVRWYLVPYDKKKTKPSAELIETVLKTIKKK